MHSSKPKKTRIQLCGLCSLTVMQPSTNADLEWCSPWILTHLWSDVSECSSDARVSYLFAFGSHIISCPVSPPLTLHIQLLVQCITVNSTGSSRPPSLLKKFRLTWLGRQFLFQSTAFGAALTLLLIIVFIQVGCRKVSVFTDSACWSEDQA